MSGDVPAVQLVRPQIDVRDKCSEFPFGSIKQRDGIFAGRSYYGLKSAVAQAVLDKALNKPIIFNDQNNHLIFHLGTQWHCDTSRAGSRGGQTIVPKKVCEITHKLI